MNRAFLPFVKSLLVATLAVSGLVSAAEEAKPAHAAEAPALKADAAKGATLFADGDATRGIPSCASCHGPSGNSLVPINPKLAGQHEAYVFKQLVNFSTGERNQPIMGMFAKLLTEADKKNVAAYLSTQAQQPGASKNKDIVDLGKKIFRGGIAEKGVAACAGCHGAAGAGIPGQYPRIAGQYQEYTVAQLGQFKAAARKNNVPMMDLAKRMSEEEIQAVADYVAGLK